MPTSNVLDMFHGDNNEEVPDFSRLKSEGIIAIVHKLTQGKVYMDRRCAARAEAALAAEMPFYGYHFNDGSDPTDQAKFHLQILHELPGVIGGCLDFEDNGGGNMSLAGAIDFLMYCDQSEGYSMPIYSGNRIREQLSNSPNLLIAHGAFFKQRMLWLAEYGPHERLPEQWDDQNAVLWQFSETGTVGGVAGHVDQSYWPGTEDELKARWRSALATA